MTTFFRLSFYAVLLSFFLSCTSAPPEREHTIKKSPNDTRSYRYLELDNQLKVFLVSDPGSRKSAAALTVYRGSNQDPEGREGLAHFLEHMLFIGTAKYPELDGYQHFISGHGGSSNAYTAPDHTNYFFDIDSAHFEEALDRFAQFFIAPLFTSEYVEREKNAVHSEYQLQLKDDGWRGQSVRKQVMNSNHPIAGFNIGSLDTLAGDVRKDLLVFFKEHYSAQEMALVALGSQDLDTLESWARTKFAAIPDHTPIALPILPKLITQEQLGNTLYYETIKNVKTLAFTYLLPSVDSLSATKPTTYLSNLLGHEGEGSLHAYLKSKGWIESLGGFGGRFDAANATISVTIQLTDSGMDNVNAISQALYDYIDLLKGGIDKWRFDEQANVAKTNFNFQEKSSATRFVYATAPNMKLYTPQEILSAPFLMTKFDREVISEFVELLTPENALVEISGPSLFADKEKADEVLTEPWFAVKYKLVETQFVRDHKTTEELALPPTNPFLPDNLHIVENDDAAPVESVNKSGLSLWSDIDTEFRTPRTNAFYRIQVDQGHSSPEELVYAHIHARLTREKLNAYAYPAQLAGLSYNLGVHPAGFLISINGYSDKQPVLLDKILSTFNNAPADVAAFARIQSELHKNWQNFSQERPYSQSFAALSNLLQSTSWNSSTLAQAATNATMDGLNAWQDTKLGKLSVTALQRGNLTDASQQKTVSLLTETLPLGEVASTQTEVLIPDGAQRLELDIDHNDASMVLYLQARDDSLIERAYTTLATHMMKSPYFTSLRTNQQLGYVVAVTNAQMRHTAGLAFIVQSPVADPLHLETQTLAFLTDYENELRNMSDAEFESQRSGLLTKLTEDDKNLYGRSARYWQDLDLGVTNFDTRQRLASAVADLDRTSFNAYFEQLVRAIKTQRLVIYNRGQFEKAPQTGSLIDRERGMRAKS